MHNKKKIIRKNILKDYSFFFFDIWYHSIDVVKKQNNKKKIKIIEPLKMKKKQSGININELINLF